MDLQLTWIENIMTTPSATVTLVRRSLLSDGFSAQRSYCQHVPQLNTSKFTDAYLCYHSYIPSVINLPPYLAYTLSSSPPRPPQTSDDLTWHYFCNGAGVKNTLTSSSRSDLLQLVLDLYIGPFYLFGHCFSGGSHGFLQISMHFKCEDFPGKGLIIHGVTTNKQKKR